jgi:DNA-binding CsgD family transcriptional regulator
MVKLVAIIPPIGLTPREYEIALLVMDGMGNGAIATALGISVATVKELLRLSYQRLGISNRTQLALKLWWELEGKGKEK